MGSELSEFVCTSHNGCSMLSDTKNKELLTRSEGLVALRDAYVFEFLDSAGHPHRDRLSIKLRKAS